MRKITRSAHGMWLIAALLLLSACKPVTATGTATGSTPSPTGSRQIFQVSTLSALIQGVFDGAISYGELRQHGDFGVGTFDALDGEMVAVDGQFYQVTSDGKVSVVNDQEQAPYADVLFFQPQTNWRIDQATTFADLAKELAGRVPSPNYMYAVRIDGHFQGIKVRSVPRQTPPYPPLSEATKQQAVFDLADLDGTLVGFFAPSYLQGITSPGLHLHFISADRRHGGHVLDFTLAQGSVQLDQPPGFYLDLPDTAAFGAADLAQR